MRRALQGLLFLLLGTVLLLSTSAGPARVQAASRSLPLETRGEFTYAAALALGLQPSTQYSPFKDLQNDHLLGPWITAAAEAHWSDGYPDGTFRPDTSLTRAMAAKIEVNALGDGALAAALASQKSVFRDDGHIPAWARGYINEAYKLGIFRGQSNGYFLPQQALTTFQMGHAILQLDAYVAQRANKAPATTLTAAQFVEELTALMGDQPTVLYIGDSPPSGLPAFGEQTAYWEEALNAGWAFPVGANPQKTVTRAEAIAMTVMARSAVATNAQPELAQALANRPTPFKDNASIPATLRGYVNEALLYGMLPWRSGDLSPNAALTPKDAIALLDLAADRQMQSWTNPAPAGAPAYIGIGYVPSTFIYDGSPTNPDAATDISFGVFDAHGQGIPSGTVRVEIANLSILQVVGNACSPNVTGTWCVPVGKFFLLMSGKTTGTTSVTLRDGAASNTFQVTVVKTPLTIDLSPKTASLYPGQTTRFTVLGVHDADGTPVKATVKISANVGTLAADGTYTAGSATGRSQVAATATLGGQTYTATSQVLTLSNAAQLVVTLTDAKTGATQISDGDPIEVAIGALTASGSPVTTADPMWITVGTNSSQFTLRSGYAKMQVPAQTGTTVTATVTDTAAGSLHHPLTQTVSAQIVGGPEVGYGIFDDQGQRITFDHPASLQAGAPTPLTLKPIDQYGNPTTVSAASPETVTLMSTDQTGGFLTSQDGKPVTTATLQPESAGIPIWYETSAQGVTSAILSAAVGPHVVALHPTVSVSTGQGLAMGTFAVEDASGHDVPWVPVAMTIGTMQGSEEASTADEGGSGLAALSAYPLSGVTGSDGSTAFILQMPQGADGDADFSQPVTCEIPGVPGSSAEITVTW
ncbi:MAG: S-layer homology domain-containing protein [Thermaerobacter sp.]|nr:S-layer homology domain-containing protein [Thermaerobacter sp.]